MRKSATGVVCWLLGGVLLAGCKIELSAGSIEDKDKPKVDENLAPLSADARHYAESVAGMIYRGEIDRLAAEIDSRVADQLDGKALQRVIGLASKPEDVEKIEYYGHGFGEENEIDFTLMQIRVLRDGGYDLVKIIMDEEGEANGACCSVVGLHLEKKIIKSFGGGGDD